MPFQAKRRAMGQILASRVMAGEAVEERIPWYHPEEHEPHGAIR